MGFIPGITWSTWIGTVFEIVAWLVFFLAGWLVMSNGEGGLWGAILSGIAIVFIEVAVQGGLLMLVPLIDSGVSFSDARWAFLGTFASIFMVAPIYIVASLLGGVASKVFR